MYRASRNVTRHPTFGVYVFLWVIAGIMGAGGYEIYEYVSHL